MVRADLVGAAASWGGVVGFVAESPTRRGCRTSAAPWSRSLCHLRHRSPIRLGCFSTEFTTKLVCVGNWKMAFKPVSRLGCSRWGKALAHTPSPQGLLRARVGVPEPALFTSDRHALNYAFPLKTQGV